MNEVDLKMSWGTREFVFAVLGKLVDRIEACGASPALTNAAILASDLRSAVGNQWNKPDPHAAQRALQALE